MRKRGAIYSFFVLGLFCPQFVTGKAVEPIRMGGVQLSNSENSHDGYNKIPFLSAWGGRQKAIQVEGLLLLENQDLIVTSFIFNDSCKNTNIISINL